MKLKDATNSNKPFFTCPQFSITAIADDENKFVQWKVMHAKKGSKLFLIKDYNILAAFKEVEKFVKD